MRYYGDHSGLLAEAAPAPSLLSGRLSMRQLENSLPGTDLSREVHLRSVLASIAEATGAGLTLQRDEDSQERPCSTEVTVGGAATGWCVTAPGSDEGSLRVIAVAAQALGRILAAENDLESLAMEVADRYEELNFLYEMSERVGGLLDEQKIADFVVSKAAWMMGCERASLMLLDPDEQQMRIRASVGLPEEISTRTVVRPGERISGKVLVSGKKIVVGKDDPLPPESIGSEELKGTPAFMSVPLKITEDDGGEHTVGVINLTRKTGSGMFTASDLKLVNTVAAQAATQIHNSRLLNAERERRQLEHELEIAARIQLSLMPEKPLQVDRLKMAGSCRPARHVGGDFFDYWERDGRVSLVVADVSGHDLGAALMATALRSVLRNESLHRESVEGLMRGINTVMFEDLVGAELLVTLFYAEVALDSGTLTFCRAGHPKPLLVRNGRHSWLDTEGQILGMEKEGEFEERCISLEGGETLVCYSDGVLEAGSETAEAFGTDGLLNSVLPSCGQEPAQLAEKILGSAETFLQTSMPRDDMTVLVARFG